MNLELLILVGSIALGFVALLYFLNQKFKSLKEDEGKDILMEWLKEMRGSVERSTEVLDKRLLESNKHINERLDKAAEVIGGVQKELGQMSEIGRRMEELQEFLRSPKLRGSLGEQVLSDLLSQTIPQDKFSLQYQFREGQTVDAAIKTAGGVIPVDAKFPLENFRKYTRAKDEKEKEEVKRQFVRDVRKHIKDISEKYILPQEGTTEFAIMYVPAEAVAYEILVHHPVLLEYAHERRVGIVSPNQFNHFLKVILIGFERQKVQERAKEILASLRAIRAETEKFGEDLRVMIKHISEARNKAGDVELGFDRLLGGIERAGQLEETKETLKLPLEENGSS